MAGLKSIATPFLLYFWLAQGIATVIKSDLILSKVFPSLSASSEGYTYCKTLVELVRVLFVCLSLMTCPNPHGYWMASTALAAAAAKFYFLDGVAVKDHEIALGVIIAPFVISTLAVLTHKGKEGPSKGKKKR